MSVKYPPEGLYRKETILGGVQNRINFKENKHLGSSKKGLTKILALFSK